MRVFVPENMRCLIMFKFAGIYQSPERLFVANFSCCCSPWKLLAVRWNCSPPLSVPLKNYPTTNFSYKAVWCQNISAAIFQLLWVVPFKTHTQ